MNQDQEHLRLLSIFHYIVGGLTALFALFPAIYLVIGIFMLVAPGGFDSGEPPPAFMGWFFILFGAVFMLAAWALAICIIMAGRFLARRTHYMFCLVMAGFECLFMPFGTVLGVFTIIVLVRESAKQLFSAQQHIQS
jgi:hypothetical protein